LITVSYLFSSFLHCVAGGYSTSVSPNIQPTPPPGTLQLLREKEKEKQKEKEREKERERARALQHLLNGQSDNTLTEFIEEDYADTEKVQLQLQL
jgi:hypothetical protein